MTRCIACRDLPAETGYLCEECAAVIHGALELSPEQVTSRVESPSDAALIDRWGRPHFLASRTLVGRHGEPNAISIVEASVSRRHAEVLRRPDGSWWVVDLVSSNGTSVDDKPVGAATRLASRTTIFIGQVGFYFLSPPSSEPPVAIRMPPTHRPPQALEPRTDVNLSRLNDDDEPDEGLETFMGLPAVDLVLAAPSGGGGGVIEVNGQTATLTTIQFDFVRVLAVRMFEESERDERVRGFVRSSELLATLLWDTGRPDDNHIKQLVRRVRRSLVRARIGDLIESRQGFGYRLRARLSKHPVRD